MKVYDTSDDFEFGPVIGIWQVMWYIGLAWVLMCGVLLFIEKDRYQKNYHDAPIYKNTAGFSASDYMNRGMDYSVKMHPLSVRNAGFLGLGTGDILSICETVTSASNGFFICNIRKEQTIKDISRYFYGDEKFFPVILLQNPHIHQFSMKKGLAVKLFEDAQLVRKIYDDNVGENKGHRFWIYTVVKNDTLQGIARRFYDDTKGSDTIVDLNPEFALKRGEKVEIQLD